MQKYEKGKTQKPLNVHSDIYQLHPAEPFSSSVFLFSSFNCPFFFKAMCEVELFQNSWKTLFKSHLPGWALGLLHFLLLPHDSLRLQKRRNQCFYDPRWKPSEDMYLIRERPKMIFYTSHSLPHLRNGCPLATSPIQKVPLLLFSGWNAAFNTESIMAADKKRRVPDNLGA